MSKKESKSFVSKYMENNPLSSLFFLAGALTTGIHLYNRPGYLNAKEQYTKVIAYHAGVVNNYAAHTLNYVKKVVEISSVYIQSSLEWCKHYHLKSGPNAFDGHIFYLDFFKDILKSELDNIAQKHGISDFVPENSVQHLILICRKSGLNIEDIYNTVHSRPLTYYNDLGAPLAILQNDLSQAEAAFQSVTNHLLYEPLAAVSSFLLAAATNNNVAEFYGYSNSVERSLFGWMMPKEEFRNSVSKHIENNPLSTAFFVVALAITGVHLYNRPGYFAEKEKYIKIMEGNKDFIENYLANTLDSAQRSLEMIERWVKEDGDSVVQAYRDLEDQKFSVLDLDMQAQAAFQSATNHLFYEPLAAGSSFLLGVLTNNDVAEFAGYGNSTSLLGAMMPKEEFKNSFYSYIENNLLSTAFFAATVAIAGFHLYYRPGYFAAKEQHAKLDRIFLEGFKPNLEIPAWPGESPKLQSINNHLFYEPLAAISSFILSVATNNDLMSGLSELIGNNNSTEF